MLIRNNEKNMSKLINFVLNEKPVSTDETETIWEISHRLGIEIPHLCHKPADSYCLLYTSPSPRDRG